MLRTQATCRRCLTVEYSEKIGYPPGWAELSGNYKGVPVKVGLCPKCMDLLLAPLPGETKDSEEIFDAT